MKIRIRGQSLRLRLTQSEVKKIGRGDSVKEITPFLNNNSLIYCLEPTGLANKIEAQFLNSQITVRLPLTIAARWATSDEVAIKHEQIQNGEFQGRLSILIEKDFNCLKVRENECEDETDMFANPNTETGSCV
jgi:hypothetical protein